MPERLILQDPDLFADLRRQSWALRRHDYRHGGSLRRAGIWFVMLILVGVGLWRGWPLAVEPIARMVPVAWEESLGESIQNAVFKLFGAQGKVCRGRAGQQAIERLVQKLTAGEKHPYTLRVTVANLGVINAFAAPGGYIVIFRGLIDKAPGPDAFAGVLAHEIGHVIERHVIENIIQALGIQIVLKTMSGDSSGVVGEASNVALSLITSGYSRAAEREADAVAVRLLNQANIRGTGLVRFFQFVDKLERERGVQGSRYLRSHPVSTERAAAVQKGAKGTQPALTEDEWKAIQAMCK